MPSRLLRPVDPASVGFFRAAFGLILCLELFGFLGLGKVASEFDPGRLHFPYPGFAWVRPWPEPWTSAHFAVTGLAALALGLGVARRLAAAVFFFGFAWIFLLDQALYLNHFYLVLLYAALFVVVPAERGLSLHARRHGEGDLPAWCLAVLRAQMGLVYLYAGIAKLNPDWLRGQPPRLWLEARSDWPGIGPLLASEPALWLVAYGGLALDLCAWPLLAWRRTRTLAFCLLTLFHVSNGYLFGIGIFPWFALAATTLFFEPDWPRRLLRRWRAAPRAPLSAPRFPRLLLAALALWFVLQTTIPLRHLAYPGSPSWSEEGHRFAWHMMLRTKSGFVVFSAEDPATGETRVVPHDGFLTERQARKLPGRPEMLVHMARHLAQREGSPRAPARVRAYAMVSLNGRENAQLVDAACDLAQVELSLRPAPWILPLNEPLP